MPKTTPNSNLRNRRKYAVKVKSGCQTCKDRHVKCSEEKPHCRRCVRSGTACDYITIRVTGDGSSRPRYAALAPNFPSEVMPSSFTIDIEGGYEYFRIFETKTSFEILPDSEPLRAILLQAAVLQPSLRYGIAALGALEKTSQSASTLQYNDQHMENRHHRNALGLYSRAITHMKASIAKGEQSLRTTLLTCIVIQCFEGWNGSQMFAVQQIQTGFSLIQKWREENNNPQRPCSISAVEPDLISVFERLVVLVVSCTADPLVSTACSQILMRDEQDSLSQMPLDFTSLNEAADYQNIIIRHGTYLTASLLDDAHRSTTQDVHLKGISCKAFMEQWFSGFERLSEGTSKTFRAAKLKTHADATYLILQGLLHGETIYDDFSEMFEEILDLAEMILGSKASNTAKFTFDIGVITPLALTGKKCRHSITRRRAIALLLGSSWREGVWDSMLVGKMAEFAADIEEESMKNGYIPAWARLSKVIAFRFRRLGRCEDSQTTQYLSANFEQLNTPKDKVEENEGQGILDGATTYAKLFGIRLQYVQIAKQNPEAVQPRIAMISCRKRISSCSDEFELRQKVIQW